jgi:hypothetical protein
MKQLSYSSITSFLAHYRILSNAANRSRASYPLSAQDRQILDEMRRLINALPSEECAALMNEAAEDGQRMLSGEERRRRERAELKLHQLLLRRGIVRG